jgi:hypothetical protein
MIGALVDGLVTTNPRAGDVLVSIVPSSNGAAVGAYYQFQLFLTSPDSTGMTFSLEALDVNLMIQKTLFLKVPPNETRVFGVSFGFLIPNGYTVRIVSPDDVTGTCQATIVWAMELALN